jgi:hypothetical protein
MDEELMYRIMAITAIVVTACAAVATVVLLCLTVTEGMILLLPTLLLAGVTVAGGWATTYYGHRVGGEDTVFPAKVEREVLSWRQRRELRQARGGLVMQRALVDIENERDNILHREIEAAEDPDKPPHRTTLTPEPVDDTPRLGRVVDPYFDDGDKYRRRY